MKRTQIFDFDANRKSGKTVSVRQPTYTETGTSNDPNQIQLDAPIRVATRQIILKNVYLCGVHASMRKTGSSPSILLWYAIGQTSRTHDRCDADVKNCGNRRADYETLRQHWLEGNRRKSILFVCVKCITAEQLSENLTSWPLRCYGTVLQTGLNWELRSSH